MIPKELFQKVRRIEITTSRLVTDVFAGQYHSVFKGQGIEFDEVREYQFGDDIRTIDWNVTARTGRPYVKKYVEERELTVMILVDISASCRFGSVNMLKSRLAAELAATLAFSAIRNHDKVGLIVFTDKIEKFIAPRKGIRHVLRIIREALYYKPQDLKKALSTANKRHDVIAITLNDPRETRLPNCGIIALEDAEGGELIYVDSSSPEIVKQYGRDNLDRIKRREQIFNSIGVDRIDVSTDSSYSDALIRFFIKRRRKRLLST